MVVLAAAASQTVGRLLSLGSAQLADETLGHHLIKALPVFPGDEDPGNNERRPGLGKGHGGWGQPAWLLFSTRHWMHNPKQLLEKRRSLRRTYKERLQELV